MPERDERNLSGDYNLEGTYLRKAVTGLVLRDVFILRLYNWHEIF